MVQELTGDSESLYSMLYIQLCKRVVSSPRRPASLHKIRSIRCAHELSIKQSPKTYVLVVVTLIFSCCNEPVNPDGVSYASCFMWNGSCGADLFEWVR